MRFIYRLKKFFYKCFHWEYWPMEIIYLPVMPFWLYYSLRSGSFFFFNASNPGIRNGGMAMESKKEIYDLLPSHLIPDTLLVELKNGKQQMLELLKESGIEYPMIVKPDIGMKALGVEKVTTEKELFAYFDKIGQDFLIQELIDFPKEIGIFYYRKPGHEQGAITGMVEKEFLYVVGTGKQNLLHLIKNNWRAYLQLDALTEKFQSKFKDIPADDDLVILVPYGSHTRGAKFIDCTSKKNEHIKKLVHRICRNIPGFYFGRLDIRYKSFEEFCHGENFKIIEVNGAGSEPTHMYDPRHSLIFAWMQIVKHWSLMYQISKTNHERGNPYLTRKEGFEMLREARELEKHLKKITTL